MKALRGPAGRDDAPATELSEILTGRVRVDLARSDRGLELAVRDLWPRRSNGGELVERQQRRDREGDHDPWGQPRAGGVPPPAPLGRRPLPGVLSGIWPPSSHPGSRMTDKGHSAGSLRCRPDRLVAMAQPAAQPEDPTLRERFERDVLPLLPSPLRRRDADDPEPVRRRGPGPGDLPAGVPRIRRVPGGHEPEGVALSDPHEQLHQHLSQEAARAADRGGPETMSTSGTSTTGSAGEASRTRRRPRCSTRSPIKR